MMDQGEGGVIINTASVAGIMGASAPTVYSAAKAGVINFTKNSAIELASFGIRVNAICPGMIYTPLIEKDVDAQARMAKVQPSTKKGDADDIANTALFLASEDSAFITGESIVVDGGYSVAGGLIGANFNNVSEQTRAGIAYGSTGKAVDIRRLEPGIVDTNGS